jgi:LPS-assembly protein
VTSRFVKPDDGSESWRFTLGQRYYFKEQQVSLTGSARSSDRSDLLAALAGQITNTWNADLGMQYSTNQNRERSTWRCVAGPAPARS